MKPITSCEVLKENPWVFKKACILAEWISWIDNLVGGGYHSKLKWKESPDYFPMDLDSMGTYRHCCQPNKGSQNKLNTKPHPICFVYSKKGYIAREF